VAGFVVVSSEIRMVQHERGDVGHWICYRAIREAQIRIILDERQQRVIQEVVPREAELQLLVLRLTKGEVLKYR